MKTIWRKGLSALLALALCLSLLSVGALAGGEAAEETAAAGETAELAEDEAAAETAVEEIPAAEEPAAEESEPVTEPETAEETEETTEESPAPESAETEPAETDEAAPTGEDANEETEIVSVEASDAAATSGACGDNLTWTLDSDGTLTISGTGEMWNMADSQEPRYNYGEQITAVVIEEGVTSIGDDAFAFCESLTSVEIPSSVTSIDDCAFGWCTGLTSVEIPSGVTSIGDSAFRGCTSLTDVYYGGSETDWANIYIGDYNECLTNATIHYNSTGAGSGYTVDGDFSWHSSPDSLVLGTISDWLGDPNEITVTMVESESGNIEQEANGMTWSVSDSSIAELTSVQIDVYTGSADIILQMTPHKPGSVTITGMAEDGRTTSKTYSVEPALHNTDDSFRTETTCEVALFSASLEEADAAYLEQFASGISVAAQNDNVTVDSYRYEIAEYGKSVTILCTLTPKDSGDVRIAAYTTTGQCVYSEVTSYVEPLVINTGVYTGKATIAFHDGDRISTDVTFDWDQNAVIDIGTYDNDLAIGALLLASASYDADDSTTYVKAALEALNLDGTLDAKVIADKTRLFVAVKQVIRDGETYNIITAIGRGTSSKDSSDGFVDILTDISTVGFKTRGDLLYGMIQNALSAQGIDMTDKNNRFFLAGHSLGGAAVQVAAEDLLQAGVPSNQLVCYTFASPFTTTKNSDLYKNEHIYNVIDSRDAVPTVGQNTTSFAYAVYGARYGTDRIYGRNEAFATAYYNLSGSEWVEVFNPYFSEGSTAVNLWLIGASAAQCDDSFHYHHVGIYMAHLLAGVSSYPNKDHTSIMVLCPVDVTIYDSEGNVVAQIVDEEVISENGEAVVAATLGDEKYIEIFDNGDYRVELSGTDTGTMSYIVSRVENGETASEKVFTDVVLEDGKRFLSEVGEGTETEDVPLYVIDENENVTDKVMEDGEEVPVTAILGDVTGDGVINVNDVMRLFQYANKQISSL